MNLLNTGAQNSTVCAETPVKFLPEHNHVVSSNRTSTFHTANITVSLEM